MVRAGRHPSETQPPLVTDAYAVLVPAVFLQDLHAILRRYLQITKNGRPIKHGQLAHGYRFYVDPLLGTPAFKHALRSLHSKPRVMQRTATPRFNTAARH